MLKASVNPAYALNGLCAYYTMFPLEFPLQALGRLGHPGSIVLDPFCGRGTTNYAARRLAMSSFGVDSSPVAATLSAAKLVNASVTDIFDEARAILEEQSRPDDIPSDEFWEWAYHRDVLGTICRLRDGLLRKTRNDARTALLGIILGALHGPSGKTIRSYFSNQAPRSFAPKPRYAVGYWRRRGLCPQPVDVLEVIERRARRYYGGETTLGRGTIILGDSRAPDTYRRLLGSRQVDLVVTSPPYYGMNLYVPDQWLRNWFVGGPPHVDYSTRTQVSHSSPRKYVSDLRRVWQLVGEISSPKAKMVVRFGGVGSRRASPIALIRASFASSGWRIDRVTSAGSATSGKRQAEQFAGATRNPLAEYDIWASIERPQSYSAACV